MAWLLLAGLAVAAGALAAFLGEDVRVGSAAGPAGPAPDPGAAPPPPKPDGPRPGTLPPPEGRLVLDVTADPARLRRLGLVDGGRWFDLGTGEGAGLHLGGWQTGTGHRRAVLPGGRAVAVAPGVVARLVLPAELAATDHEVTLVAAVPGSRGAGQATVYVDDETIDHVRFPADGGFGGVRVTVPGERLAAPGPHVLSIRVPRVGRVDGVGQAGILLDQLGIVPLPAAPGDALDEPAEPRVDGRPDPSSTPLPPLVDGDAAVRLAPGAALAFVAPLGATGGWLRARTDDPGLARLAVEATVEGSGPPSLSDAVGAGPDGVVAWAIPGSEGAAHLTTVTLRWPADALAELRLRGLRVTAPEAADGADGSPSPADPTPPRWRNAVVILCDTLRADALQAIDPTSRVKTPSVDRLAAGAATFLAAHAQENWTKPSVATLLSGLLPWEHGAQDGDSVVPRSARLLSERLRDAGFHTGAFIANGYVSDKFGFERGWSTWRNYIREGRRTPARFVARDVLAWLDERPPDARFFLYVHTIDPHVPYIVPDEDLAQYDPDPYAGPVDFGKDRDLLGRIKTGKLAVNARDRRRLRALYDAEISYHDHHLATILEALDRRGLAEETIVVFTSDHGEEFFDHGSVGHGHSVYEELLRVPLMIRLPGWTDGGFRTAEVAGLVDVAPTLFDGLGLPIPDDLSGRSLLPGLRGEAPAAPPVAVSAFMNGWRSAVEGPRKLVQRTLQETRLYDLASDPGETRNLAAERPVAVDHLRWVLGRSLTGEVRTAPSTVIDPATAAQLRALGYAADFRTE